MPIWLCFVCISYAFDTLHFTVPPQGFQRVYDEMPELSVDVPHAHVSLEAFVELCFAEAVITKQLRDACPSRSVQSFTDLSQIYHQSLHNCKRHWTRNPVLRVYSE